MNHTDDIYLQVTTIIKRDIATLFRAIISVLVSPTQQHVPWLCIRETKRDPLVAVTHWTKIKISSMKSKIKSRNSRRSLVDEEIIGRELEKY